MIKRILQHKKTVILFLIGLILFCAFLLLYRRQETTIPAWLTLLKFTSWFFLLIPLFLFFTRKKKYLLSNLFLVGILMIAVELIFFFLLGMPNKQKQFFSKPDITNRMDSPSVLGTAPHADTSYMDLKYSEDNPADTAYYARYTIDKNYRRFTPDHDSTRKKYALFFGCSITFGQGLNDNETFPYAFQKLTQEYNSYNYGYIGYGTNQMLARLQHENLSESVQEKDGIAFYVFFDGHINRNIAAMSTVSWTQAGPYYYLKDNELIRKGTFQTDRFWTTSIYKLLSQSSIFKYFKIDLPFKYTKEHFQLTVRTIKEAKKEYQNQFGNDEFYVITFPSYHFISEEDYLYFLELLKDEGIKCYDLRNIINYTGKHTFNGDPHPTAQTDEMIAEELVKRMKNEK